MKRMIVCLLTASLLLTGCTQNNMDFYPLDKDGMERLPYLQID